MTTMETSTPVKPNGADDSFETTAMSAKKQEGNNGDKPSSLVELKNGKLVLRQKLLPLDRMMSTMKEMLAFNEMLQTLTAPLQSIPDEHLPLIAKLVNESDKSLALAVKRLKSTILPQTVAESQDELENEDDANLPPEALEKAVLSVADRVNYGLDGGSAALSIWRWEVKDDAMLPPEAREKCIKRRSEREQAKRDTASLIESLSEAEKAQLLPGKDKLGGKDGEKAVKDRQKENLTPESKSKGKAVVEATAEGSKKKAPGRPKKLLDGEQNASAEKEKPSAKADKKRKGVMNTVKAAASMTAWLGQSKGKPSSSVAAPTASPSKTDFERTFQPFVRKKDTDVAPLNKFVTKNSKEQRQTVVLDSQGDVIGVEQQDVDMDADQDSRRPTDLLREFLSSVPGSRRLCRTALRSKTEPKSCVKDIVARITEAEVNGDARSVRQLQQRLNTSRNIPVKLLQFHESVRPAYFGTWTRSSAAVGPRAPFGKDHATFDYSYDSGDDWNEEEEGGEDVMSDNGSDHGTSDRGSDEEDEFAGWLVDDDEVEEGDPSAQSPPPEFDWPAAQPQPQPKRKRGSSQEPKNKRRKIVAPLIPYSKGPCWESAVGECEYEPFMEYRIQVLTETPFPLDPFTFVAPLITITGSTAEIVAAPPPRQIAESPVVQTASAVTLEAKDSGTPVASVSKTVAKPAAPPKYPFPDQHLPALLQAVEGSTKPRPVLIEDLFAAFKHLGVKKNAIDAKLKEVCVKDKKVWKVLEEAWKQTGAVPSTMA